MKTCFQETTVRRLPVERIESNIKFPLHIVDDIIIRGFIQLTTILYLLCLSDIYTELEGNHSVAYAAVSVEFLLSVVI